MTSEAMDPGLEHTASTLKEPIFSSELTATPLPTEAGFSSLPTMTLSQQLLELPMMVWG